jgi:hypothetical protein
MFNKQPEERLTAWKELRERIDASSDPLTDVALFWSNAPLIPFNHNIDQYNAQSWSTPWEIIVENKYDDFTLSLMIAWTLKLTNKFRDSNIEIKSMVDEKRTKLYNLVYVDNTSVLNYDKWTSVSVEDIPKSLLVEYLISVKRPR